MRIFYTLLVSGLLILPDAVVDQQPPMTADDLPYGVAVSAEYRNSLIPSFQFPNQYKLNIAGQPKLESQASNAGASYQPAATGTPTPSPTPLNKLTTADTALASYGQPSALPVSGYAMFYNPNVMQEVLANRVAMGHISQCPECVGNVALLRAGDLNRRVWLEWEDGIVEGPFLVADVAARHHVSQLLARRWVVDVDNRTAMRRGMAGPVPVTVWASPPSSNGVSPAGGEVGTPPFAPLYAEFPTAQPTPFPTALPAFTTPVAALGGTQPTPLPVGPTATPTVTPLPFIDSLTTAVPPILSPIPTAKSLPTDAPIVNDLPLTQGFPADTPVPTITPLPVIQATATSTAAATQPPTATPTPTALPPIQATFTPTGQPTQQVVIHQGFPTDTPVPTVTALPYITSTPTPSPN